MGNKAASRQEPSAVLDLKKVPKGPIEPTLGAKLMDLIERHGFTVAGAADAASMTRQQLWRIVQGDVPNPGIMTVQIVVEAIGANMADLFEDGPLAPGGLREIGESPPKKR